jgi:pyruvate formate lyase activating enzyme
MQPQLAEALLRLAKAENISTAIETCGYAPWTTFEHLLPYLDVILFDLKHLDLETHQTFTGVSNKSILSNLGRLTTFKAPITIRIPLIPGFNASEASLRAMGKFISEELKGATNQVNLLPYHTLGRAKYHALGRDYPWQAYPRLTETEVGTSAEVIRSFGLEVTIGG